MAWFLGDPSAMHTAYGRYGLVTLEDVCYFYTLIQTWESGCFDLGSSK